MNWAESIIRRWIPPTHRPDPTAQIEEVLQAQRSFLEHSAASTDAAEEAKAGIEATTEKTKKRNACQRTTNPQIKAARDALKVLERH